MLTVKVLSGEFPEPTFIDQWNELLVDSPFATPFQTPAWTQSWWRHFGGAKTPHWVACYEGDDLVGLFPMYRTSYPWRTLRAIGTGQSDYLHPLIRAGRQQAVCSAFASHFGEARDVDMIDLQQIREGIAPNVCDTEPVHQAECLVLDLPTSYDDYLKGLSKSLRFDCRRLDKEPFKSGKARIVDIVESDIERAMHALFDLHGKRWKSRWQPGAFATKKLQAFHRDAAAALVRVGYLRVSVLESEGQPAGVIYGMKVGDRRFFYQCGFDPVLKALSPGTLLVADAIDKAIAEGCARFDFMRGDEPYKRRWNPQHSHRSMRYILPLNSGLGTVGLTFNHARSKIEERVRARLEGRSLFG